MLVVNFNTVRCAGKNCISCLDASCALKNAQAMHLVDGGGAEGRPEGVMNEERLFFFVFFIGFMLAKYEILRFRTSIYWFFLKLIIFFPLEYICQYFF